LFPRSTAEGLAAHWYPEKIDRRMYSYMMMSAPDGRTMFAVKDGGSLLGEIESPAGTIKTLDGDFFNLFGTMVLRDYPLDKMYYGTLICGAVSLKSVTSTSVTSSAEASNLLNRKVPFMHSYSFFPGAIVEKDRPFVPRCMVFPPSKGVVKITLTQPNGEKVFVNGLVDDRGLLNKFLEETPILWQDGVHVVHYSLFAGISNPSEITGDVTASDESEFPFYVVQNNRENNFAWSIPVGSSVDYSKPYAINAFMDNTNLPEAKAFYTLSFNGELIETGEAQLKDNTFEVSINLPRIIEKITNLDPKDPFDVIEMGCMVKGVNEKGKIRFLASRITIRNGRIEY